LQGFTWALLDYRKEKLEYPLKKETALNEGAGQAILGDMLTLFVYEKIIPSFLEKN
jgi:hypothetical protein